MESFAVAHEGIKRRSRALGLDQVEVEMLGLDSCQTVTVGICSGFDGGEEEQPWEESEVESEAAFDWAVSGTRWVQYPNGEEAEDVGGRYRC